MFREYVLNSYHKQSLYVCVNAVYVCIYTHRITYNMKGPYIKREQIYKEDMKFNTNDLYVLKENKAHQN